MLALESTIKVAIYVLLHLAPQARLSPGAVFSLDAHLQIQAPAGGWPADSEISIRHAMGIRCCSRRIFLTNCPLRLTQHTCPATVQFPEVRMAECFISRIKLHGEAKGAYGNRVSGEELVGRLTMPNLLRLKILKRLRGGGMWDAGACVVPVPLFDIDGCVT